MDVADFVAVEGFEPNEEEEPKGAETAFAASSNNDEVAELLAEVLTLLPCFGMTSLPARSGVEDGVDLSKINLTLESGEMTPSSLPPIVRD